MKGKYISNYVYEHDGALLFIYNTEICKQEKLFNAPTRSFFHKKKMKINWETHVKTWEQNKKRHVTRQKRNEGHETKNVTRASKQKPASGFLTFLILFS